MSLLVICGTHISIVHDQVFTISVLGTVLSLLQKPSSLLGPLFHLLFATAALPLLVYTFLATVPNSNPNDNDILSYAEDVAPTAPTTPRKFQSHLTLPLSPSFLSFSSPPPSPCSNRTFSSSVYPESRSTKTKKCTSLDLPSTHPHSIQLKHGTNTEFGAKKSAARPATAPICSKEKKIRPRPAPLDLSLQLRSAGTGSRRVLVSRADASSQTVASNHEHRQAPKLNKSCLRIFVSKGDLTSTTHRLWSFLLIAQVAALLVEGLRICAKVVLAGIGNGQSTEELISVVVMDMLANMFFVVQVGCVMSALTG